MTIVLVHGNLERDCVWDRLVSALRARGVGDDILRLSPPGFGAPLDDDFDATTGGYRDWLVAAITDIGTPVDLVGHDWGGLHTLGVAMERPDLLRSWASDVVGLMDPNYVWHEFAQCWQDPEHGGRHLDEFLAASPAERARQMAPAGLPLDVGTRMFSRDSTGLARAVISLYRSAIQPALSDYGRGLSRAASAPGLAIRPTGDPYSGDAEQCERSALCAGARVSEIPGAGHWWLSTHADVAADALVDFWAGNTST